MEADWEIDAGPDAPSIVVPWEGFVELRGNAHQAMQKIPEAADHPALGEALVQLNSAASPLLTSKCDVWELSSEEVDPYEFGSSPENSGCGFASYIDLLLVDPDKFVSFDYHELIARHLTERLRARELKDCRVDLVVRPATVDTADGFGVTLYTAGCGSDQSTAYAAWQAVLGTTIDATMNMAHLLSARASSSIG